jgi:hypothetical protein
VGITLTGEEGHLNAISKSRVTNMVCAAWGFPTPSILMRSPPSRSVFYSLFAIISYYPFFLFEKRLRSCAPFFVSSYVLIINRRHGIYGRKYKKSKGQISGGQTLKKNMKIEKGISIIKRHLVISSGKVLYKR